MDKGAARWRSCQVVEVDQATNTSSGSTTHQPGRDSPRRIDCQRREPHVDPVDATPELVAVAKPGD
jgi:hypothetical protein